MPPDSEVVLITGSSGLIGSAVVNRLAKSFRIAGFDRAGPPHPPPVAEAISVDFSSDNSMDYAFERLRHGFGTRLASVIHLAAYYSFSKKDSPLYEEITVRGTERLIKRLKDFQVEQFIFSSTMLVHAPCEPDQRINEDRPLQAKWAYPASKIKTEAILREMLGSTPLVMQRIAGIYDDKCHSIPISHQIQRIYEKELTSHFYPGDLRKGQSFLHLEDLVDVIERTVLSRKSLPAQTIWLLGEPSTLSYGELQRTLGKLLYGKEWKTWKIPKPFAKVGAWLQNIVTGGKTFIKPWMIDLSDDHYALDISRVKSLLNWQPRRTLQETIPHMIQLLKKDPASWYRMNKLEAPSAFPVQN